MNSYPETIPSSEPELTELLAQLERWRDACDKLERADSEPIYFGNEPAALLNQVLTLDTPYTDRRCPFDSACGALAAPRAPLDVAVRERQRGPLEGGERVRLVRGLQVQKARGDVRGAQTYAGRFLPESDRPGDADESEVIVKIYQASYSIDFDEFATFWADVMRPRDWEPLLTPFRYEAWAYEQLAQFQGSLVPYVYGFFKVILPHGEPAIVLVMEYVRGTKRFPLPDGYQSSPKVLNDAADKLLRGLQNLKHCGITSEDLSPRNVIWPSLLPSGELPCPVFIDFAQICEPSESHSPAWTTHVIILLRGYGFETELLEKWVNRNFAQGSEVVQWFAIPDDQVPRLISQAFCYTSGDVYLIED